MEIPVTDVMECSIVEPLTVLGDYMRKKYRIITGESPRQASKHAATKIVRPLLVLVRGKTMRSIAVTRIVEMLDRDYKLNADPPEERERVLNAINDLVQAIEDIRKTAPLHALRVVKSLRYVLMGIFYHNLKPVCTTKMRGVNSHES